MYIFDLVYNKTIIVLSQLAIVSIMMSIFIFISKHNFSC